VTASPANSPKNRRKYFLWIGPTAVVLAITWMILRPDRIAQLNEVPPELIAQVEAAIPMSRPTSTVSFRFRESSDGSLFIRNQLAEPVTLSVLRRNTKRYNAVNEIGVLDETTSLSIGPIQLVRHSREPLPLIGDLLPNQFWGTRILKRFEAKSAARFPGVTGETFEAKLVFESRYSNGDAHSLDESRLVCTSLERVPARNVHASLTGEAVKVRCEDSGALNAALADNLAKALGDEAGLKKAVHVAVTESWYIEDLAMSVQTLFQEELKGGDFGSTEFTNSLRTLERVDVKRQK
jgi:hypothetical protein